MMSGRRVASAPIKEISNVPHSSFDDRADTWDDADKIERAQVLAAVIASAVAPDQSTRVFEYGAGTGLVSEQLAPSVGPLTLADPSEGMRRVATSKVNAGALPEGTRVWGLDLAADKVPDDRFDLIVTVMTLHHIAELDRVLAGFATLLDDGGHLCIVDLEKEDGSFHADPSSGEKGHFHVHDGFDPDELASQLADAGFTTRIERSIDHVMKNDHPFPLFMAVCTTNQ